MSQLIEEFKKKRDFYCEKGASVEDIDRAEKKLARKFAEDYIEYLKNFGSASCGGHELTGFSGEENLDVVSVTIENAKLNPNVDNSFYVIEETHIDGIVIWQDALGRIYQAEYKDVPTLIHKSLVEYIATFENVEED